MVIESPPAIFDALLDGIDYRGYRDAYWGRLDEKLIRKRVAHLLIESRDALNEKIHGWMAQHITPATRTDPRSDPALFNKVRMLRSAIDHLEQLQVRILTLSLPSDAMVWHSRSAEIDMLAALRASDQNLIFAVADVREAAASLDVQTLLTGADPAVTYNRKLANLAHLIALRGELWRR